MACARTIPCCGRRDATRAQDRPVLSVCGVSVMLACVAALSPLSLPLNPCHSLLVSPSHAREQAAGREIHRGSLSRPITCCANLDHGLDVGQDGLGRSGGLVPAAVPPHTHVTHSHVHSRLHDARTVYGRLYVRQDCLGRCCRLVSASASTQAHAGTHMSTGKRESV